MFPQIAFCFTFTPLLPILSFTKQHSLPPLTRCPPFMIKVQATNDLTHSQNIPAREEGATPLLSKGNQGHTDPIEALSAEHATNRKMEGKATVGIFSAQHFHPLCPCRTSTASWWGLHLPNRSTTHPHNPSHICSFKLSTGNSSLHFPKYFGVDSGLLVSLLLVTNMFWPKKILEVV